MSSLLRSLCEVHSPSGEEREMKHFILDLVHAQSPKWEVIPRIFCGEEFQDCIVLIFGKPEVAAFAHMDTTGFTVRYQDQLVPIGSPEVKGEEVLTGADDLGQIECNLKITDAHQLHYRFGRGIRTGTNLVYKSDFLESKTHYISPYLDNRIGIYNLLKVAESLKNGALVFSCWEEQGGGSVPFLVKFLYERYKINKMLISDVTWISDGIKMDDGVVISYRDRNIPRRTFVETVTELAVKHQIPFQMEVEAHGSSDAREIQMSPYPIDWCFIGPPVENAHSSMEKVSKMDVKVMINFYQVLMHRL